MADLDNSTPSPTEIKLHHKSRVYSPSAAVTGHGPGQEVLHIGKQNIEITQLGPVGTYAVQPVFSDGHDTGIYSWDYFYSLGMNQDEMWQHYLRRMEEAGASREPVLGAVPQRLKSK